MDATLRRSPSRPGTLALLAALVVAALAPLLTAVRLPLAHPTHAVAGRAASTAHALPVQFEQNQGQADPAVRFLAREPGGTLFLTDDGMVLSLTARSAGTATHRPASAAGHAGQPPAPAVPAAQAVIRMRLVGGAASPQLVGLDPQATSRNYMVGDRSHWHLSVPSYAKVAYRNVYPGVDLVFHGGSGAAEYDFVVAPAATPHAITLRFSGQRAMRIDGNGDLVLDTASGPVTQHRPLIYQHIGGTRHDIPGRFHLFDDGRVGFEVGAYDASRPLVVDPVIAYSTFLGGSGQLGNDKADALTVDSGGNAYIVGGTQSPDFPVTTQLGPRNTTQNAYVVKLNASGSMITWSTVFGGSNTQGDNAQGVALDPSGNVWVTGFTHSTDFPTTPTAFKAVRTCQRPGCPETNAFVTEFNPLGGTILYSSYLGGGGGPDGAHTQSETGAAIVVDSAGKAYVTGTTSSPDFPTTTGAFQSTYPGVGQGFVSKVDGSRAGAASLVYSTFLGAGGPSSIAVDASGNAVVGGATSSSTYPVTAGAFQTIGQGPYPPTNGEASDGFLTKLNAAGSALLYSTYLGGTSHDAIDAMNLGPSGRIYAVGHTESTDFPTTSGAFSRTFHGGSINGLMDDAFLTVISPSGGGAADLRYSTYLGGNGDDDADGVVVDAAGNAFVSGQTKSSDWPLVNPLQGVWGGQNLDFQYNTDVMLSEIRPSGGGASDLIFSTYLGGSGDDFVVSGGLALGPQGTLYIAGYTLDPATPAGALSVPFPTTRGAVRETWTPTAAETGFVTKLDLSGTTALLAVPGSDGSLYTKSDANPYQGLGGVLVAAPALVAVPGVSGALPTPLFIAVGSDHNLYVRSLTQGWQTLSSSPVYCIDTAGATVTTSTTGSTLTIACQGSDHGLWYAQGTVTSGSLPTVSGWQGLGGTLSAGPAVGTVAGNLTFLVVGGNGQVYSRTTSSGYAATGWGCIGHVALASYRTNAYFACQGGDHALWYSVNPGTGWVQVQSAGGVIADSPAIVATPAEVIVYVEGSNKAVYHVTLSPGGGPTTPWVNDGGSIQFGPGATTLTP